MKRAIASGNTASSNRAPRNPASRNPASSNPASSNPASSNNDTTRKSSRRPARRSRSKDFSVLASKTVFRGPVFHVDSDRVREGRITARRDVVRHSGSVVIIPIEDDIDVDPNSPSESPATRRAPRILLIRQFRYAAAQRLWEIPAGRIDAPEYPLAAARRELLEETGYTARTWSRAFRYYASPGFLDETMDVFLARNLRPGPAQPEDDENIAMRWFSIPAARALIDNGKIIDAKTMMAIWWWSLRG